MNLEMDGIADSLVEELDGKKTDGYSLVVVLVDRHQTSRWMN
jgi:hypothetical protein